MNNLPDDSSTCSYCGYSPKETPKPPEHSTHNTDAPQPPEQPSHNTDAVNPPEYQSGSTDAVKLPEYPPLNPGATQPPEQHTRNYNNPVNPINPAPSRPITPRPEQQYYHAEPRPVSTYPPPHPGPPPTSEKYSGLAIASMVLGILSILSGCVMFPFFVLGLIFGIVALRSNKAGRGMAIAGIVTSSVSLVITIILIIAVVVAGSEFSYWTDLI